MSTPVFVPAVQVAGTEWQGGVGVQGRRLGGRQHHQSPLLPLCERVINLKNINLNLDVNIWKKNKL